MSANLIIKIEAPEIVEALNKLTAAVKPQLIQNHYPAPQAQIPAPQTPVPQPPAPTYAPTPQQYQPQPASAPMAPYAPVAPMARPATQQQSPRPANPTPAPPARPVAAVPTAPMPAGPSTAQPAAYPSNPAPVAAAPAYTQEQLARATATLADAGKIQQIRQLFQQFGIQQLTALPKERYGEYATALRQLGVRI